MQRADLSTDWFFVKTSKKYPVETIICTPRIREDIADKINVQSFALLNLNKELIGHIAHLRENKLEQSYHYRSTFVESRKTQCPFI